MNVIIEASSKTLNRSVRELDIVSGRAVNAMGRMGAKTIEDVINKWDELPKIHQIGYNTVKVIKNAVINFLIENATDEQLQRMCITNKRPKDVIRIKEGTKDVSTT